MKIEVAVYQYEKFIAFARSTDMPGFDIRQSLCPAENIFCRSRNAVDIDNDATAVVHQVFAFSSPFHDSSGNKQRKFLFTLIPFFRMPGKIFGTEAGDSGGILFTSDLVDVLV